ncbi:putative GGDEF domain protein [Megalodesulfovibrio gigas DSM 1382 = ATCC 19364]|uniref:diguanylate cyclase n=2 Tax=Megalodesulfovibrio gigas TaxID=879 RepID=T2G987_MEGG1|nr:putative GGDEF domain protein [Megalodesulfovibrio gigas DSM 1382 = ATCC 19364]
MSDASTFTRIMDLCRQGREGFRAGRPEQALAALEAVSEIALHAMAAPVSVPGPDALPVAPGVRVGRTAATSGLTTEQARLQLMRLKVANKALAVAYESTITAFQTFREGLDVVQQVRTVQELPALCEHIAHLFSLAAVELVMAQQVLPADVCPPPTLQEADAACPVQLDADTLAEAWTALQEVGTPRCYIGPATALEHPAAFFPVATRASADGILRGSCFVFPFHRGNSRMPLGFLSLLDADPGRYTTDMATDYLEHFCAVFEAIIFSMLEKESVSGRQYLDPLTGIRNRTYLEHYGRQLLEQAGILDIPVCLLFLDLDHFKPVNDAWGHETGDLVLREVARTLDRVSRRGDVVCRIGGDEFIILLPDASTEEASSYAKRLHAALAAITPESLGLECEGRAPFVVRASIGMACHSQGMDLEALLNAADGAMYAVKQDGREPRGTPTPS